MVDVKLVVIVSMCLIAIVTAVPRSLANDLAVEPVSSIEEHQISIGESEGDEQPITVSQADLLRILTRMNVGSLLKEDRTLRHLLSKVLRANSINNMNHNSDNSFIKRGHIWKWNSLSIWYYYFYYFLFTQPLFIIFCSFSFY